MKTFTTILILGATIATAHAQKIGDSGIPKEVKASFAKQFPNVRAAEWEKEGNKYVAEFEENGLETEVEFDAKGNVLEVESEIFASALPEAAQKYLANHEAGKKPHEVIRETDEKGKVSYEVEFKGAEYEFDASGNLIKAEEEDGDDDKEDDDHEDNNGDRP